VGIFALFLLPRGRPRRFAPELDLAVAEEAEGSICLGGVEEEVALEEEDEVSEVSRRLYLRGAAGVDASNLSAGIEALAQRSAAKRRAIMTV
jgi:sugar/nucleoside kinase (ribokinase family)